MLQIKVNSNEPLSVDIENESDGLDIVKVDSNKFHLIKNNKSYNIEILEAEAKSYKLNINGTVYTTEVINELDQMLEKMGMDAGSAAKENDVKAPMPGLIVDIKVKKGEEVKVGDPILVLEAMKMENVLKATTDATIASVDVKQGTNVEKNEVLVTFE